MLALLFGLLITTTLAQPPSCKASCKQDSDCVNNSPLSPCTFCSRGVCVSLCGIGCRSHSDCQNGGSNPCIWCSEDTRTCVNPRPLCGGFCNSNVACLTNGTDPSECSSCDQNKYICRQTNSSKCGKLCSGEHECAGDPNCYQCVGYYCSPPASCGQNCISSGQCQNNPGNCKACIGAQCENTRGCGGACGGDDWCGPRCPVCGFAKCVSHTDWEHILGEHEHDREEFLKLAEIHRSQVRLQHASRQP